jgi:hypothetical protein
VLSLKSHQLLQRSSICHSDCHLKLTAVYTRRDERSLSRDDFRLSSPPPACLESLHRVQKLLPGQGAWANRRSACGVKSVRRSFMFHVLFSSALHLCGVLACLLLGHLAPVPESLLHDAPARTPAQEGLGYTAQPAPATSPRCVHPGGRLSWPGEPD